MQDYRKLQVWQKGHHLVLQVYKITQDFPADERYGLTSQLRRAAVSIPANIAEGSGRNTRAEFARFLHIAMGSASEVEYHLLLAHDLGYIEHEHYRLSSGQVAEVKRMLTSLTQKVSAAN